jgi:hypothetical protein
VQAMCAAKVVSLPLVIERSRGAFWIYRHAANRIEYTQLAVMRGMIYLLVVCQHRILET